ncbi:MAG TPA: universal stress protein, partial [Candidatus Binatia bacterium]|nr:universal stress protein [Candidatus Binatia bacterium]
LVSLKKGDRVEDFVPYIENVARPGTKVVFLIRNSTESWRHLKDHWISAESAREAIAASQEIIAKYSWEAQREWAEQKISNARYALQQRGIEVEVEIYRGALREAIKNYTNDGGAHLIMMRAGMRARLLHSIRPWLGSLRRSNFSPVLLLRLQQLQA